MTRDAITLFKFLYPTLLIVIFIFCFVLFFFFLFFYDSFILDPLVFVLNNLLE